MSKTTVVSNKKYADLMYCEKYSNFSSRRIVRLNSQKQCLKDRIRKLNGVIASLEGKISVYEKFLAL